jgi:DNA-binding NarL/FixJ family response regulator
MSPVRVVIVDDHIVFREGLRALLARVNEIEVVGEAGTTDEAIDVTSSAQPDVVLMDLNLPGDGGVTATQQITSTEAAPAVLVLTMHSDDTHLQSALHAGARGYLLKDADPEAIVRAVMAVHNGQVIFDEGIAGQVIAATSKSHTDRPFPTLTEREFEILDKMSRGLRNDAIAARAGLSIKTVQNNVSAILLKLGATDRAHAVAMARDAGLGRTG